MPPHLLSPTVITGWLECDHSLTLTLRGAAPSQSFGPFADLVREKGQTHEAAVRQRYLDAGLRVHDVQDKGDQDFAVWADEHRALLATSDHDALYQLPLMANGIRGICDFVVRVDPDEGWSPWEPVDAKLSRSEAKPGHLLQLCFYAEAIEAATGLAPKQIHIELGSGRRESYRYEEFGPYWRRMRSELTRILDEDAPRETRAEPCTHCEFCDYAEICEAQWRAEDSLVYVADLGRADRHALEGSGIDRLETLATLERDRDVLPHDRLERVTTQADLQLRARRVPSAPPVTPVSPGEDPMWGHGFSLLPRPDDGDVFFDLEGHPFLTPDAGLFFLFGLLSKEEGEWTYTAFWAHDLAEQASQAAGIVHLFDQRRRTFPLMHVYHYNHTERSALASMTEGHEAEVVCRALSESGLFVDLRPVVKNAFQIGIEQYGLKDLERVTGFTRKEGIHQGSGAVLEYEAFSRSGEMAHLEAIARYNEDDVRSTLVLRDWLCANRPAGARWRDPVIESQPSNPERDELVARLLAFDEGSTPHVLGNLLGYWKRETSAEMTPKFEQARSPMGDLIDNPDFVTGMSITSLTSVPSTRSPDKLVWSAEVTFPEQHIDEGWEHAGEVLYTGADLESGFARVQSFDPDARTATLSWSRLDGEGDVAPVTIVRNDFVRAEPKPGVIETAGRALLDEDGSLNPATADLLTSSPPRFTSGGGPISGVFSDDVDEITSWVGDLDASVAAIQGPPGTGKTFRGARIVRALLQANKRVGIMAPSHASIDNFFASVVKHFDEEGILDELHAVRKIASGGARPLEPTVTYRTGNAAAARPDTYNLVGGTSWFFCSRELRDAPVDTLIVDEAGQMSLADVTAASLAATNLILLGDPQQLDHVSHATHPAGSGASSLEHVLEGAPTIPSTKGVFIEQTWRMHPSICHFISSQMYEDRLYSHPSCARQEVLGHGSGLRWIEVDHRGQTTSSDEEAQAITAMITELLGGAWIDQDGVERPLGPGDFMVVAPFNDQTDTIRRHLEADPLTAAVAPHVGTVDKFQGREAPVVFFSMTTSSSEELTRGADFLFSKSRLNVAISRARCLAYLVSTSALLGTRASTVDGMRLIGTLNAFVEEATPVFSRRAEVTGEEQPAR